MGCNLVEKVVAQEARAVITIMFTFGFFYSAVYNQEERYRMVRAIKWVDEVREGAPYV